MVGVNAAVFAPVLHDDLEKTMERILASGCDAVVGGYSACILAEHRGIPSVVIKTGQDTVARAVDEAVRTVDRIRGERVISQMYKTIIYLNMPLRHALLASFLPSAQTMHESLFTGYFLFHFVLKSS